MYDRPTAAELIDAVRLHMETSIVPAVREDRQLYFRTLVAINVLKIVERELAMGADHNAHAWARLNIIDSEDRPLPTTEADLRAGVAERHAALCHSIRVGHFDEDEGKRAQVFEHLKATTVDQLQVANPRYLSRLAQEDADPSMDAWHNRSPD